MHSLSFKQLFSILFALFVALLLGSQLFAWTGPTSSPPNGNVAAPINVGSTSQIKDGSLGVNALAVYGTTYIENKLGINDVTPVVALDVNGTARLGNGGEVCQAVTEGSLKYNSTSKQMEFCNGTSWAPVVPTAANLTFSESGQTSTATVSMPVAAKGLLTIYANVCVPNAQATVVSLNVDGVLRNSSYHRDAANSGGVTCTVETLTYHGQLAAGSHTITVTLSQSGAFTQPYYPTRNPAVQGYILYPIN